MGSHTLWLVSNSYYHFTNLLYRPFPVAFHISLLFLNVNPTEQSSVAHSCNCVRKDELAHWLISTQIDSIDAMPKLSQMNYNRNDFSSTCCQQRYYISLADALHLLYRHTTSRQSVTTWCRWNSWLWDSEIASQGVEVLYIYIYMNIIDIFNTSSLFMH